jgi:hypothetical protein
MEHLSTSFIADGLHHGLQELVVGELRLDEGRTEELEGVVREFLGRAGKLEIGYIWSQHENDHVDDNDWIAELDWWGRSVG